MNVYWHSIDGPMDRDWVDIGTTHDVAADLIGMRDVLERRYLRDTLILSPATYHRLARWTANGGSFPVVRRPAWSRRQRAAGGGPRSTAWRCSTW